MRVRSLNSTDTYPMHSGGTNTWIGGWEGRFSRPSYGFATDGVYLFDIVDRAGNVGSGSPGIATAVIDTVAPVVSTYSTLFNNVPATSFFPASGFLDVVLTTDEPLSETGAYWLEVRNDSNIYVNRLPLTATGTKLTARWDGTKEDGQLVFDGAYSFTAMDYTGNRAGTTVRINVVTAPFNMTSAKQVTSTSVELWFSQEIDASSIPGANVTIPGQGVATLSLKTSSCLLVQLFPGMVHQQSYECTVFPGTLKSVFGIPLLAPNNRASFVADVQGPIITNVRYDGLTGQKSFLIDFDEEVTLPTADQAFRYSLIGPTGSVGIVSALRQSNKTSVFVTVATDLQENQTSLLVQDLLGEYPGSPRTSPSGSPTSRRTSERTNSSFPRATAFSPASATYRRRPLGLQQRCHTGC